MLLKYGYAVTEPLSYHMALQIIEWKPDVLLLDIDLASEKTA